MIILCMAVKERETANSFGKQSKTVNHVCMNAWPYIVAAAKKKFAKKTANNDKKNTQPAEFLLRLRVPSI